jgi:N-methylhydantoinase B/oxoprolinase/acetone carboxylase alpha subunit
MTEKSTFRQIDPVTIEVVRNKLESIAEEMQWTLLSTSFSAFVKEGMDCSASLFTPTGTTLAQACAIPIHLTTLIPCVANILEHFPVETMREGDVFCMNDPYAGGTHIPDIAVVVPVLHGGRVIALSAAMTHHGDLGGMSPGSVPTNATSIFQEGVRIPALRLCEHGVYNDTLIQLLCLNIRIPDTFMGDLRAQVAACTVGMRRLVALADRYGDPMSAIFDILLDRSELLTRLSLRALPAGTWRCVAFLDNDGIELEKRIRIEIQTTIGDGSIHFDFTGTSPQVKGPFNCVPSGSQAAAYFAVRALTDPSIPTNGGCFRSVSLTLPEGSIVNPRVPAPVNSRAVTIKLIANCMIGALSQVVPDKVPAFNANQHVLNFGGQYPDGANFVMGEVVCGGTGARAGADGIDVLDADATNGMNMPIEALELDFPLRMNRYELRPDTGGAGEFRGGLGVIREYESLAEEVFLTHRGENHRSGVPGAAGGGEGARARSVIVRADGRAEVVPSKLMTILAKGDRLICQTAGGGGFGDPQRRSSAAIHRDIVDGKLTAEGALLYGVRSDAVGKDSPGNRITDGAADELVNSSS